MHRRFFARIIAPLASIVVLAGASATVHAQAKRIDLAQVTLEDLMKVEITSAGRKEQRLETVSAAVFVITQDDIRHSGIRSLPELFRLVPGTQVAQLNSNKWAVSVRGFNDVFSDKLLVLIDGRSIYKRTFSGTFWHAEDVMLEDIDRIEVVRGSGGAVWGANAVNGVINIITKSATETRGARVQVGAGSSDRDGAARFGGTFHGVAYRVYGLWNDRGTGLTDAGASASDDWNSRKAGFRADWSQGAQAAMVQGSLSDGRQHGLWTTASPELGSGLSTNHEVSTSRTGDMLGRWTYEWASGAAFQAQSFYSRQNLHSPAQDEIETTEDVDIEYRSQLGSRHDVVAGGGFRNADLSDNGGSFTFSLQSLQKRNEVVNLFVQDEIRLTRRVHVTVGTKFEHDRIVAWNILPTARLLWDTVPGRQHLWVAVSKAARTPSLINLSMRANFASFIDDRGTPVVVGLVGNPDFRTERFLSTEAGYRISVGSKGAVDIAAFHGHYRDLATVEPMTPVFETTPAPHLFVYSRFANLLRVDTTGVELSGQFLPVPGWRIEGSYSGFRVTPRPYAESRDAAAAQFDGNAPAHQWQAHSSIALGTRTELNAGVFYTGRLRQLDVPSFTRIDARAEVKLGHGLAAIVSGQNLLDRAHVEFASAQIERSQVRRTVHLRLAWEF